MTMNNPPQTPADREAAAASSDDEPDHGLHDPPFRDAWDTRLRLGDLRPDPLLVRHAPRPRAVRDPAATPGAARRH